MRRKIKDTEGRIKDARKKAGLTQKQLSGIIERSITCLSDYENGREKVHEDIIKQIAAATGADISYLMYESNFDQKEKAHLDQLKSEALKLLLLSRKIEVLEDNEQWFVVKIPGIKRKTWIYKNEITPLLDDLIYTIERRCIHPLSTFIPNHPTESK